MNDRNTFDLQQNVRPSFNGRQKGQSNIRSLKSQLVNFKDSLPHNLNGTSTTRVLQDKNGSQTARYNPLKTQTKEIRINTQQNLSTSQPRSLSTRSTGFQGIKPINNLSKYEQQSPNNSTNSQHLRQPYQENKQYHQNTRQISIDNKSQYGTNQPNSPRCSIYEPIQTAAPRSSDISTKLQEAQKKIQSQHQQYLKKCLQLQKNKAFIATIERQKQCMQIEIQKYQSQIENQKKNSSNISKMLNDSRLKVINLQGQNKKLICLLDDQKLKYDVIYREKQALIKQIQNFKTIKQYMLKYQQTQEDKKPQIKNHIAYQLQMIQVHNQTQKQLDLGKGDLKQAQQIHNSITTDIAQIQKQISSKVKQIISQKQRLQRQLDDARAETQAIRKNLFISYQQKIDEIQNQIIQLKEQNMNLKENSEFKIKQVKLEREISILNARNKQLIERNKQFETIIDKLQNSGNYFQAKKNPSQVSSQTSIKAATQYYDSTGHTDLSLIIQNYQTRSTDLSSRINQKQANLLSLKTRLEQLQQQNQELKDSLNLQSRKQRSITQNSKNQVQTIKLQLKNEKESLRCKMEMMETSIKRKNKQIKEKDQFITQYLISKIKGQKQCGIIVEQINKYFENKV